MPSRLSGSCPSHSLRAAHPPALPKKEAPKSPAAAPAPAPAPAPARKAKKEEPAAPPRMKVEDFFKH